MSIWSEMSEADKDAARARYESVKQNGIGKLSVLGTAVDVGPMDPAAKQGLTVDEYLEKMYDDLPGVLKLAKSLAPAFRSLKLGWIPK